METKAKDIQVAAVRDLLIGDGNNLQVVLEQMGTLILDLKRTVNVLSAEQKRLDEKINKITNPKRY